jgi:hemolysin activation/secretion protein
LWAEPAVSGAEVKPSSLVRFDVKSYQVSGSSLLTPDDLSGLFAPHTGTNVSLDEIVKVAGDLHQEFRRLGYPLMSVAFAPDQFTNGIVTFNVFQTAVPQVVVSGHSFLSFPEDTAVAAGPKAAPPTEAQINTNPPVRMMAGAATPAQVAEERQSLQAKMQELAAQENDHRVHVVPTPGTTNYFTISKYLVDGNTILSPTEIGVTLTNIDGAFGTNVTFDGIRAVATELQKAYQERGYVTVAVGLPPQKLTNATIKVHVTEGRLIAINVIGNHYFSSNNVMRQLPSLHTNMLLNGPIFQSEVNRANANQDRQIYPVIGPGPDVGTSKLTLTVKDRFPVHGKVDLDDQSSPGTPLLRVNASAVEDNLWQMEHQLGVQYGFSPEAYKQGSMWDWYDQPLVANYSTFYRMPLGNPEAIDDTINAKPGAFGYDEATRRFNLPPPSGRLELNVFASRSTIDTGVEDLSNETIYNVPGVRTITLENDQQDLTINNDVGFRLSAPLPDLDDLHSTVSGGFDYKTYEAISDRTNNFRFTEQTIGANGQILPPTVHTVSSAVPATDRPLNYLPLSVRYDGTWNNFFGAASVGLGLSFNLWYSGTSSTNGVTAATGLASLQGITGSGKTTGHWVTLTPTFSQIINIHTNWPMTVRLDGQWASEPLISNEQFGAGGINSVRGYREGEVFGDSGWHFSMEQQTPPHVVGMVRSQALTIRGSLFMDYAKVYLIDPQTRQEGTPLWGTGVGGVISLGSVWDARFMCSVPLLDTATTTAYQPFFNFALTAQF